MFVKNFMTKNPVTATPEISHPEAMNLLRKHKIRRLPIMDDGKLVGIVVEKDLLTNQPSPATTLSIYEIYSLLERLKVEQLMSMPVITVEGDCSMEEAARIMIEEKIGCLPVMDGKKLVGIITETDIFKVLTRILGGGEGGIRVTIEVPDRVGQLANVTKQIADAGGNIHAVTAIESADEENWEITIKEEGADESTLKEKFSLAKIKIIDIRKSASYTPRNFG